MDQFRLHDWTTRSVRPSVSIVRAHALRKISFEGTGSADAVGVSRPKARLRPPENGLDKAQLAHQPYATERSDQVEPRRSGRCRSQGAPVPTHPPRTAVDQARPSPHS